MPEIEDKYLTGENTQENDIITFVDGGVQAVIKDFKGNEKKVYNFKVNNGRYELIYTPNLSALKVFKKAWGTNSDNWINKMFQVKLAMLPNKKYMIVPEILC